jgi:hypothetical protein
MSWSLSAPRKHTDVSIFHKIPEGLLPATEQLIFSPASHWAMLRKLGDGTKSAMQRSTQLTEWPTNSSLYQLSSPQ